MKRNLAILILLLGIIFPIKASAATETVYLKNGSVINGVIIEQKPGVSLKIKTRDGNIFHYDMSDVEKISKTTASQMAFAGGAKTGYRGFFEAGYTIGTGDFSEDRIDLTTSHGYQVCPYFFAGAGVGFNYWTGGDAISVPLFADLRADILDNWFTPFVDLKIGYSVADISGFYMSPSIGCRFGFGNNLGMHLSLGYTLQKATAIYYGYSYYNFFTFEKKVNAGGVTLKLGLEF